MSHWAQRRVRPSRREATMRLGLDSVQVRRGNRRGRTAALAVTAMSLIAAGCGSGGRPSAGGPSAGGSGAGGSSAGGSGASTTKPTTRTFTDAAGQQVTIPVEAKHLGLPFPYNTSDAILLGACQRIATTTTYSLHQSWV